MLLGRLAEEQGLMGALLHAQKAEKEHIAIDAVLNNDIVGNDRGGNGIIDGASIRVYSDGPEDSPSRELAAGWRPRRAAAEIRPGSAA